MKSLKIKQQTSKISHKANQILGDLKTPKFHSEINWPLLCLKTQQNAFQEFSSTQSNGYFGSYGPQQYWPCTIM